MAVVLDAPRIVVSDRSYSENAPRQLLPQTLILTRRLLLRLWRTPMTIVHALILPAVFLLAVDLVLGDSITALTGEDALYRSVPLVTLVGTISGATAGVIGIIGERSDGFLARLWTLPVHRGAGLVSRLVAEAVRVLVTALVVMGTGMLLGLRFHQGVAAAALWLAVPLIFGVAFSMLAITIALYWSKAVLVEAILTVGLLGTFFCTGLVPVDQYPDWIQPLVRYQPMSPAVDAMRGLSVGGPVLVPTIAVALWSAAICAVCLVPLARGYRRASTNR